MVPTLIKEKHETTFLQGPSSKRLTLYWIFHALWLLSPDWFISWLRISQREWGLQNILPSYDNQNSYIHTLPKVWTNYWTIRDRETEGWLNVPVELLAFLLGLSFSIFILYIFSLKVECEKMVQEKAEMQRHYVMVSIKIVNFRYALNSIISILSVHLCLWNMLNGLRTCEETNPCPDLSSLFYQTLTLMPCLLCVYSFHRGVNVNAMYVCVNLFSGECMYNILRYLYWDWDQAFGSCLYSF
jgi:hypothetical protein